MVHDQDHYYSRMAGQLEVRLGLEGEPEELAQATLDLRRELLETDVAEVRLVTAPQTSVGAKSMDVLALGLLAVTIGKSGVLSGIVAVVRTWLDSHPKGHIRLELDGDVLELTAVSSREQRRLADEWLARRGEKWEDGGRT